MKYSPLSGNLILRSTVFFVFQNPVRLVDKHLGMKLENNTYSERISNTMNIFILYIFF